MATKDKKKQGTYKKHYEEWKENQEITSSHPELTELFKELARAKQNKIEAEDNYNKFRHKIGEIMKSCHSKKVFNLATRLQVTISSVANRTTYKFNEDKFKKEHPNMYKMYLEPTSYTAWGGQLFVRQLNASSMADYSEFESEVE